MRLFTLFTVVILCLSLSLTGCSDTRIITPDTEEKVDTVVDDAVGLLTELLLAWLGRTGEYQGPLTELYDFEDVTSMSEIPKRDVAGWNGMNTDDLRVYFAVILTTENFWYNPGAWCQIYLIHYNTFVMFVPDTMIITWAMTLTEYGWVIPDVPPDPIC